MAQAEFTDLVGENSPFLSALLKVYKKKADLGRRKDQESLGKAEHLGLQWNAVEYKLVIDCEGGL